MPLEGVGVPVGQHGGHTRTMARLSSAQRRVALVQAALDVIAEAGIAGATTRAVTERAGMPLASFHYVFTSQEALFEACLDEVVRWEAEVFADFEFTPGDLVDKSHQVLDHLARMIRENSRIQLALYHLFAHAKHRPGLARTVHEYQARTRELIGQMVADALDGQPGLTADQLECVVSLAVSVAAGMTTGFLRDGDAAELDRVVEVAGLAMGTTVQTMLAEAAR